jgi:hypothetical protein
MTKVDKPSTRSGGGEVGATIKTCREFSAEDSAGVSVETPRSFMISLVFMMGSGPGKHLPH